MRNGRSVDRSVPRWLPCPINHVPTEEALSCRFLVTVTSKQHRESERQQKDHRSRIRGIDGGGGDGVLG